GSRLHGVEVGELRLPAPSAIGLIVRDRRSGFVPSPDTRLREGDELLIVTTMAAREATERRLRAVSRGGRLARRLRDDGGPDPPLRSRRVVSGHPPRASGPTAPTPRVPRPPCPTCSSPTAPARPPPRRARPGRRTSPRPGPPGIAPADHGPIGPPRPGRNMLK